MITNKQIGYSYEYFILNKIKHNYDQVWHWSKVPEYVLYDLNIIRDYNIFTKYRYDIGADLVAKKDDKYYFIQCKNFSKTILMDHLAGFYFLLHEYNLNGILYYSGKLSQRVLDLSTGKIQFINLPFNNQTISVNVKNEKYVPKEYQLEAYNILKTHNKCILSLPCGMGKTYVASMLANDYNNIIILAPLRYLAQQLLINMSTYLDNQYNPILVSMDGSRDIDKIKSYMGNKNIFSCTYDSSDVMIQLINQLDKVYLIIDEFHNLSSNNIGNNESNINKIMTSTIKHLYLSATPIKNFICDNKYEYSWQDAIKNKYICDFDIIIQENNQDLYKFSYLLKHLCSNNIDIKLIAKTYFMLKGMMYFGNRKCICYMTSIEKANDIHAVLYWMSKLLNVEIDSWIITCNTAKTNRAKYLYNFKKSNKLSIIINVHILDEGIDIPDCDSVFITQPNNNIINVVQRMCRANRITENKTKCQIFLWCTKRKTNKILEYLSDNTNGIINDKVIRFKTNDMNIVKLCIYNDINKIGNDISIDNKNHRHLYDLINNNENKILIFHDVSNEIWYGMYEILKMLKYNNIDNAINTIKISDNNKIQYKMIKIKSYDSSEKKPKHNKLFVNTNGLIELLSKSNKMSAKKILNEYMNIVI